MRYNLISNISNGAGLEKDTNLLKGLLESYGHTVTRTMFNDSNPTYRNHDFNIFLEVVAPGHFRYANKNILVPNSEWWYPCWDNMLPAVSQVWCKTKACYDIWCKKVGASRCVLLGFEANDFYNPEIKRVPTFLHLAGKSETKNTATVCAAWRDFNLPYPLIVSAFKPEIMKQCQNVPNLRLRERLDDYETINALNACQFHIMPSKMEGYGHAIHEALGCGGIVITTDAPPMNEFGGIPKELLIPVASSTPRLLTKFYEVTPMALAFAVNKAARLPNADIQRLSAEARAGFLADREQFRKTFAEVAK